MPETKQLCTFWLDGLLFGIDVCKVQEVLPRQDLRRVPLAPGSICGLLNLRGQVVTAIDLRVALNLPCRAGSQPPAFVIVRTTEEPVSFLVDEICDILDVDGSSFEPPPRTLRGVAVELLTGVYKLQQRLLLELNAATVIERGLAAPQESDTPHEQDPPADR